MGTGMDYGGNFNEIGNQEDKQGGKKRVESSFNPFRTFNRDIEMREVAYRRRRWIWASNRQGEGFIEERLDMCFGSADWHMDFDKTEV